jgi:putative membrane protein insertion efficiency factor
MLNQSWHTHWGFALNSEKISDAHQAQSPPRNAISRLLVSLFVLLITIYQRVVSPWIGPSCRFHPTCSSYAVDAIRKYGPFGGTFRALARLGRCHPLSKGGYDPVL